MLTSDVVERPLRLNSPRCRRLHSHGVGGRRHLEGRRFSPHTGGPVWGEERIRSYAPAGQTNSGRRPSYTGRPSFGFGTPVAAS